MLAQAEQRIRSLTDTEVGLVSGGETLWGTEVWIIGGEEVWVYTELQLQADGSGYEATGNYCIIGDNPYG